MSTSDILQQAGITEDIPPFATLWSDDRLQKYIQARRSLENLQPGSPHYRAHQIRMGFIETRNDSATFELLDKESKKVLDFVGTITEPKPWRGPPADIRYWESQPFLDYRDLQDLYHEYMDIGIHHFRRRFYYGCEMQKIETEQTERLRERRVQAFFLAAPKSEEEERAKRNHKFNFLIKSTIADQIESGREPNNNLLRFVQLPFMILRDEDDEVHMVRKNPNQIQLN